MTVKIWPGTGRLKDYNSPLQVCAICGRGVYESEGIHRDGKWYHSETCYDPPQEQAAQRKVFGPRR